MQIILRHWNAQFELPSPCALHAPLPHFYAPYSSWPRLDFVHSVRADGLIQTLKCLCMLHMRWVRTPGAIFANRLRSLHTLGSPRHLLPLRSLGARTKHGAVRHKQRGDASQRWICNYLNILSDCGWWLRRRKYATQDRVCSRRWHLRKAMLCLATRTCTAELVCVW